MPEHKLSAKLYRILDKSQHHRIHNWTEDEMIKVILAIKLGLDIPDITDLSNINYTVANNYTDLAEKYINDNVYGDLGAYLKMHINYKSLGRDLRESGEHVKVKILGKKYFVTQ